MEGLSDNRKANVIRRVTSALLTLLYVSIAGVLLTFAIASPTHAVQSVPYQMNFQGRLNDSTGAPMPNGTYNMTFRIYSVATGGTALWTETHLVSSSTGVTVTTGGLFSVQLGSVTSLPPSIFDTTTPLYLEVELPSPATATSSSPSWTEGPMSPRNPIESSPYAINADELDGMDSSAFAAASGSSNYLQNTTSPQSASFSVTGSGTIAGAFNATGSATFADSTSSATAFQVQNTSNMAELTVNTSSNFVSVGSTTASGTAVLFSLSNYNGSSDPSGGVNGAMYYNSSMNEFRCYTNGAWANCGGSGSSGSALAMGSLDGGTANSTGATISGSTLYLQSASTSNPGLVNTSTQSFAGNKTFTGNTSITNSSATAFQVQNAGGTSLLTANTTTNVVGVTGSLALSPSSGATPTVIGSGATNTSGTTSLTVATNSSTKAGDLVMIVSYMEPANEGTSSATYGTITTPSGVTLLPGYPLNTDDSTMTTTDTHRQYVWYYYATANGSQNLTFSDSADPYWGLTATTIRGGVTSGDPLADAPATATVSQAATGVTSTPAVSLTLGGANSLVLWAYTDWNGSNSGSPSGYTNEAASTNETGQPAVAYDTYSAAGSTGTVSASRSGNDKGMIASLLSFRSISTPLTVTNINGTQVLGITANGSITTSGNVTANGSLTLAPTTNNANELSVQNAAGASVLNVNTTNSQVSIGSGDATGQLYIGGNTNTTPIATASLPTSSTSYMAVTNGNYTYVGDLTNNQLDVFNIADPHNVTLVNTVANMSQGNGTTTGLYDHMEVSGHYLFLNYNGDVQIYDITDPTSPKYVGVEDSVFLPDQTAVQGNYLYVTSDNGGNHVLLYIFDISNPANIREITDYSVPSSHGGGRAVAVQGQYAYLVDTDGYLYSINIANPASPYLVGTVSGSDSSDNMVQVYGSYAYTIQGSRFNISNPASPVYLGQSSALQYDGGTRLIDAGNSLYGTRSGDLFVDDITNPPSVQAVATYNTNAYLAGMSGRYMYMVNGSALQVYDMGGTYTQQLQAGSTQTGSLQVDNSANVSGALTVQGAIGANSLMAGTIGSQSLTLTQAPTAPPSSIFGDAGTNVGGTFNQGVNYFPMSQFTTGASAVTVSYLNTYAANVNSMPYNKYQMGIYTDSSGSPGSLVAGSGIGTLNTSNGWNSIAITPTTLSANTKYWIGVISNTPSTTYNQIGYDGNSNCSFVNANIGSTFGTLPSSISSTYSSNASINCISVFASTYPTSTVATVFQIQNSGGTNLMAANVQLGTVGLGQLNAPSSSNFDLDSSPETPTLATSGTAGTTTYTYAVAAVDSNGVVGNTSQIATISTGNATLSTSNYIKITVKASAGNGDVSCYNVYRVSAGGTSPTSTQTGLIGSCVSAGTFTDKGVTADPVASTTIPSSTNSLAASTAYYYDITTIDSVGGESAPLADVTTSTGATGRSITMSWQPVAGARGYNIYRGTSAGTEQFLATVSANTTSYIDSGTGTTVAQSAPTVGTAYATQLGDSPDATLTLGTLGASVGQLYISGTIPMGSVGTVATGSSNNAGDMTIQGHYAYTVDHNGNVSSYDITNPMAPRQIMSPTSLMGGGVSGIITNGSYAYVCQNNSVAVLNISNPATISYVGSSTTSPNSSSCTNTRNVNKGMYIEGNYLFVGYTSAIVAYNITNPATPVQVGSINDNSNGQILINGGYMYTEDGSTNLKVYNIANPASISLLKTIPLSGSTEIGLSLVGNYLYALTANGSTPLQIYDVTNPASPNLVNSYANWGNNGYVIAQNGELGYDNQGYVWNLSNPTSPSFLGQFGPSLVNDSGASWRNDDLFWQFDVQGRYAYTYITDSNNNDQLAVYDLGGAYTSSIQSGSSQTGSLQVDSQANVNGNLSAQSLNVSSASQLNGTLGVAGATTFQNTTNSTAAVTIQDASGTTLFTANTVADTITLGSISSGNYLTFSSSGGLVASGTAQHQKTILLTPEYAGAVLDASSDASCSSANTGTMTSGYSSAAATNYYLWTATSSSAQCYDVVVQVPIPSDFSSWSGTPNIQMEDNGTGTGTYAIQIIPSSGTDTHYGSYVSPGTLGTSWANMATTALSGTYTPGTTMTIKIRLSSTNSAAVQLGDITLTYNSAF